MDDDDELSVIDYKLIDSNKLEKDAHIKHEVLTGLDEITSGQTVKINDKSNKRNKIQKALDILESDSNNEGPTKVQEDLKSYNVNVLSGVASISLVCSNPFLLPYVYISCNTRGLLMSFFVAQEAWRQSSSERLFVIMCVLYSLGRCYRTVQR